MTHNVSHMNDSWNVTQHSWNETSIYANDSGQCICKLNLEDWDVNEDNQYDLEKIQLENARLIRTAPDFLRLIQSIQQGVAHGTIQMDNSLQDMMKKIVNKATVDPIE